MKIITDQTAELDTERPRLTTAEEFSALHGFPSPAELEDLVHRSFRRHGRGAHRLLRPTRRRSRPLRPRVGARIGCFKEYWAGEAGLTGETAKLQVVVGLPVDAYPGGIAPCRTSPTPTCSSASSRTLTSTTATCGAGISASLAGYGASSTSASALGPAGQPGDGTVAVEQHAT